MNIGYRSKAKISVTIALTVCALLAGTVRADDEYRDFEDVEGRVIRGKVVAFDDATETVSFQRESDGQVLQVKLTVFAHPDRQYIRDWTYMNGLMKDLKISAKTKKTESIDQNDGSQYRIVYNQWFDVVAENMTEHDFGQINMEYCIFYRQGSRQKTGMVYDEGTCYGQSSIELTNDKKKVSFKTKSIKLFTQQSPDTYFGRLNDASGEIRGIWIKAKLSLPSGERFTYEFRSSRDPKWKWTTKSVPVGMNADEGT